MQHNMPSVVEEEHLILPPPPPSGVVSQKRPAKEDSTAIARSKPSKRPKNGTAAAATSGRICSDCGVSTTVQWRRINDVWYCNACGCARKRRDQKLKAAAAGAGSRGGARAAKAPSLRKKLLKEPVQSREFVANVETGGYGKLFPEYPSGTTEFVAPHPATRPRKRNAKKSQETWNDGDASLTVRSSLEPADAAQDRLRTPDLDRMTKDDPSFSGLMDVANLELLNSQRMSPSTWRDAYPADPRLGSTGKIFMPTNAYADVCDWRTSLCEPPVASSVPGNSPGTDAAGLQQQPFLLSSRPEEAVDTSVDRLPPYAMAARAAAAKATAAAAAAAASANSTLAPLLVSPSDFATVGSSLPFAPITTQVRSDRLPEHDETLPADDAHDSDESTPSESTNSSNKNWQESYRRVPPVPDRSAQSLGHDQPLASSSLLPSRISPSNDPDMLP